MTTVLARTQVICPHCSASHPATIERDGNQVVGRYSCGDVARSVALSGNADLYEMIRRRSYSGSPVARTGRRRLLHLLPLTQHCNMRCPVCYAEAGPESDPQFLPVGEAISRIKAAKQRGARVVTLTGGEAVLHPELPLLIRKARRVGVRLFLLSNGLAFAREPALARDLKRAGLARVALQFDTLDPDTLLLLRGTRDVEMKCRAAHHILNAGLHLGLIATVTRHNLSQLGDVIRFGLSLGKGMTSITLQAAAPVGRFALDADVTVDKEQILAAVLRVTDATKDDVWPLPAFAPWGLTLHPDCGVNLIALTDGDRHDWLRSCVDIPALFHRMAASGADHNWWARNMRPLRYMLAATYPGKRIRFLRHMAGFMSGRSRRGMVIIGMGAFCRRDFFDTARVVGCATDELRASGGRSPCLAYSGIE